MINSIPFLLLTVKYLFGCGVMTTVLIRPNFRILRTKVSQDLLLIRWIPAATYETNGLGSIIWMIYIPFFARASALTHLGVRMLWDGFSSHFPAVTSTVGIFPSKFLIRRFYNTLINRFFYFHALVFFKNCFKRNGFTIKHLNIRLLAPSVGHTVQ